eukprot:s1027_g3.t1
MTALYGNLEPVSGIAGSLSPAIAAMKFCHPIFIDSEFTCEAAARERAMGLALELALQGSVHADEAFCQCAPQDLRKPMPKRTDLHVGFATDLEFFVGVDDDLRMHRVILPESSFACGLTAWSGCLRIAAMHVRQHVRVRDLHGRLCHDFSGSQQMAAPLGKPDQYHEAPLSLRPLTQEHAEADPLSLKAVCISSVAPIQFRRTDDWINPRPSDFPLEENPAEAPDPDVIPDPVNAPAFVHDLFQAADQHQAFTNMDDEGLLRIRTWYLHHAHHRRMTLSRTLEFYEDWRHWEPDILTSWRDFLQANEETEVTLVFPDPFRGYLRQTFHADLIISQGTWLPSLPGLVTIHYRGRQSAPYSWAVAASFNLRVSGFEIATAAGVLHWCQSPDHQCWLSFAGTAIPFDPTLRHRMRAGHSFVVTIEPSSAAATGSTGSRPFPTEASCSSHAEHDQVGPHQSTSPDYDDQNDLHDDGPPSPDPPLPDDVSDSSLHSNDKGVLIYGLHAPERHCFVTWTTYMSILDGIVHGLHLRKTDVRCFHHLSVQPLGLHSSGERAVILQMTADIDPGSPEKLILVDIEVHFHPSPSGLVVPTATSRRVMKVNPHLHREQILLLLDLSDYCQLQRQRCLLHKNNQLWDHRDRTVHDISHGDYVRVQVPPPDDQSLDTEVAISIAREFGTTTLADCSTSMPSLSLFQSSVLLQQHFLKPPCQLRSDIDADYSMPPLEIDRPSDTLPRSLPSSRGSFSSGHLHRLQRLLTETDLVECEEEGPVGYITTWYIHHEYAQDCRVPRPARLSLPPDDWLEQLLDIWSDLIDPTMPTTVCLVKPQPPCGDLECTQAHLILVQGLVPDRLAILISVLTGDDRSFGQRQVAHSAHSVSPVQNVPSVLRLIGYDHVCVFHRCLVRWKSLPFAHVDWEVVDMGANIEVHITPIQGHSDSDQHSLLQLPADFGYDLQPQVHGCDLPDPRAEHCAFQFNRHAAPFGPGLPSIFEQTDFIQEVYHARAQTINTWEDDDPSAPFAVWFVDHHRTVPHCDHFRIAHLQSDFTLWTQTLEATWIDQRHHGAELDFYLVLPNPPLPRGDLAGHILLVQRPNGQWVTSLVSIYDNRNPAALPRQIAVTTHEHIFLENILRVFGLFEACVPASSPFHCTAWYGVLPLRFGHALPGRSGYSIVGQFAPRIPVSSSVDDSSSFLQLFSKYVQQHHPGSEGEERLTGGTVAHARRPSLPQVSTKAIKLIAAHASFGPLPSFIEIPVEGISLTSVKSFELGDTAAMLGPYRLPGADFTATALHHMKQLHSCGHPKAVIKNSRSVPSQGLVVLFEEPRGCLAEQDRKLHPSPIWPPEMSSGAPDPMFTASAFSTSNSSCLLRLGVDIADLQDFFTMSTDVLHTSVDDLDLPEDLQDFMSQLPLLGSRHPDRYVIYVDGSSQGPQQHRPPAWIEEMGMPDAWAMVVLAECYATPQEPHRVFLVGWTSQQVRYGEDSAYFLGSQHVGSLTAEREGMTWAMLWRAGCNNCVPTLIRSDSQITCQQARGLMGAAVITEPFLLLRGVGQLLDTALPHGHFMIEHVHGHNGDPLNDFVDFIAKREAASSFYLRRLPISMHRWRTSIPHLWMLFGAPLGCPRYYCNGFDITAPALPASQPLTRAPLTATGTKHTVQIKLSLCTANVLSMYFSPEGYAGKLSYLVEQFCAHGLVLGGLQETRTPMGTSRSGDVLRFCSGALKGQGGVELWVNLKQPYGWQGSQPLFFRAEHFQVLLSDPHRLVVRVITSVLDVILFVGHAPHSGRSDSECREWWDSTVTYLQENCGTLPLLVMIDANAAPGDSDNLSVFHTGLPTSRNTCHLRTWLDSLHLALPQTLPLHQGGLDTWISLDGERGHCIDYIAIPQSWISLCVWSQLLDQFDLGNAQQDHSPVAIELHWTTSISRPCSSSTPVGSRIDRSLISQVDPDTLLRQHGSSWDMDVEQQVDRLNRQILSELHQVCPARRGGPKKSFISAELWQHRRAKLQSRSQLKAARHSLRRETLALTFRAWTGQLSSAASEEAFNYKTTVLCGTVRQLALFHRHAKALKRGLQQARRQIVASTLQQLPQSASASAILHALRPLIGTSNLKNKGAAPLPIVQQADGSLCQSPDEALSRWIDFFGQMEGGTRLELDVQRQNWLTNLQALQVSHLELEVDQLPTLVHLEAAFRHVANGKATGPDQIPSEVCHLCPAALARHTFALLLKGLCHGQEALLHKGGRLVPLWKGKMSQQLCEAYRSILISSHVAKSLHRALRLHQASIYELYLQRQQIGGQRKAPVTYGVHVARAYHRAQKSRKRPSAFIFLDLREAFYRVLRPLALSGDFSDTALAQLAARLNLSDNILHDLRRHLQEPGATERAGMPPHLSRTLRALHLDTHWYISGQSDACSTTIGSRPGDAFADIVFGYLWSRVLQTFREAVDAMDVFDRFPADSDLQVFGRSVATDNPEIHFMGPCWMDDLCIALSSHSCTDLIRKVQSVASELLDQCLAHAMTPNLAAGKTEVLFSFHGPGSRQAKRDIYGPAASLTMHLVGEYHPHEVRVVSQYLHLGSILHHSGDQRTEINRRLGIAHQTFTRHRRHLFGNPAIPWDRRVELFQCLVLSKFLYGTESWTIRDVRTKEHLHSALMRLYRRLLRTKKDSHLTDDYILFATGLPSPSELLRVQRLRYLGTLENCHTLIDWGVVNSDPLWLTYITEDLRWLHFQLQGATHLPDPDVNVEAWLTLTRFHPGYWKRLIRRACLHACRQRDKETRIVLFHQNVLSFLQAQGFAPPEGLSAPRPLPDQAFGCMQCKLRCQSKGGEGAHMNRKHQIVNPAHLLYSDRCRTALIGSRHRFSPLPGSGSHADGVLAHRHNRLLPPLPVQGPCPLALRFRDFDQVHWELHDLCCEALIELTEDDDWETILRMHVEATAISWTCCQHTLQQIASTLSDQQEDEAVQRWGLAPLLSVLQGLSCPEAWPFLEAPCPAGPAVSGDLALLESHCLAISLAGFQPSPRAFGRHRIILHAFSGRRRVGDFQFYLDAFLLHCPAGVVYHTVSLDIMVDAQRGDISKSEVRQFWLDGIDKGWILAMLAGPPCETWSRARSVKVADSDKPAPRVLRTADALWGLPHLRLRELLQIDVGNLLLLFTAEAFLRLAFAGGCAIVEHPREPDEPELASIWRLPIFHLLRSFLGVEFLSLNQGLLGAASAKPTNLMTLNLPGLERTIVQHQVSNVLPKGVLSALLVLARKCHRRLYEQFLLLVRPIMYSVSATFGDRRGMLDVVLFLKGPDSWWPGVPHKTMRPFLLLALCQGLSHGWWFATNHSEPPDPPSWWDRLGSEFPRGREAVDSWSSWTVTAWTSFRESTSSFDPTRWEYGLWMVVDTMVSFGGWAIFGSSWNGVRTGCRRILQIGVVLALCLAAHYVWAVCYPVVSILVGLVMAMIWILRRILRLVGTVFFYVQKFSGLAPEAADVNFVGPATGAVPETSALRSFKRAGDQVKQVVVKRGSQVAVFNVGTDAQSIRTHGLYLPVEPDTLRGDNELVQRLKHVDRVHLCRNLACTEEGGEHFLEYGVVKRFNPERFQTAQAHGGAIEAGKTLWSWMRTPDVGHGVHKLVGKLREYASESETEDAVRCCAGQIKWHGESGLECLAPNRCTAVGTIFKQVLHEDVPADSQEVGLCSKHATAYLSRRVPMKCCVIGCNHEGTKLQSSVRWCVEHCPRESRVPPSSRRSRSRSRARLSEEDPQTEVEDFEMGYEEDEENGVHNARHLLQEAVEAGAPHARPKRRAPSRSPGHTPKGGLNRHLAKIGMLNSPGTDVGESMLERFMEKYAMGRDEGTREDQVRSQLCREHLYDSGELLKELIKEAEEEQSKGQRGLTRFLTCWRKEAEKERRTRRSRSDSDWSLIASRNETPQTSPEQETTPLPVSSTPPTTESSKPLVEMMTPVRPTSIASSLVNSGAPTRLVQEPVEIRIAPPGLYKNDRKAGTGEGTEPMEHIARAIQSQTAELATLVRHQAEGGGVQPTGTIKGLNRQSEELVFLMRACGQYNVQVGGGEHGQALANSLLAAQVGASTKLRSAGFRQKMTTRLAVGIAGPYWGTNEKFALSASDFLSFTDAELDQFASENKGSKGPLDQRPPLPVRFDEWVARVRRQTDVWCLVYGEEWRTVRTSALDLLSQWHLAYPHRWPLAIIMDLWEELAWRLMEDFKDILRKLKKEIGRETLTLNELRFHALLPGPDGQAWLQMPTTFDLERPDSWFQTEVIPRIERKQERLLWNLTWQNGGRREKPQGQAPPTAGASVPDGEKPTLKSLWGPKLTAEEVNRAKERAPLDKSGNLLCWGNLCHIGCSNSTCQRSHDGLRGTFESLDPCVQMQLLKRGGLKRMKLETKEGVNQKVKEIRQRMEKDKAAKIQDGRRRDGRAGEKEEETVGEESSKAGGTRRSVRFWDVPEEFKVDYTQQEDVKELVRGPNQAWGDDTYQPRAHHAGRDGQSAPEEARHLVNEAKRLAEQETLKRLEGASDDLYSWAAARVAREPGIDSNTLLSEMATYGLGEVAREAADLLEDAPTAKAGSSRLQIGETQWQDGCPGKGTMTLDGQTWQMYDFKEEVYMTDELAGLLKVTEPVVEKRQCVTLAVAAGVLYEETQRVPTAGEVQRRAQLYRLEQTRLAVEASQVLGEPAEMVTAVEHEMRVYIHDLTTAHHEKDFRSLAVFPISDLQDVKVVVLRTDYKGGMIVESVVGPHWKPGNVIIWVLIHKGHMTWLVPPSSFASETLLDEEEHTATPAFGFTFFWHSRHDQAATSPGKTHCRLCRTARRAGAWTDCFRQHSCLAMVAAVAGGAEQAQVVRGVRAAGAPYQGHELVLQEVFAGSGRITAKWKETCPVEEPIEVFEEPHHRRGYRHHHDLLLEGNRKDLKAKAVQGPANVWWLAAPCTSFCDWQLQNGGTRTFQDPEGGHDGPQQQREIDGNSLSTLAADTFESLLDEGAFPVCESSAGSGRYPKQWDLPAWKRVLARSDVEYIEFPMCAFGLGPPDQPGHFYAHITFMLASKDVVLDKPLLAAQKLAPMHGTSLSPLCRFCNPLWGGGLVSTPQKQPYAGGNGGDGIGEGEPPGGSDSDGYEPDDPVDTPEDDQSQQPEESDEERGSGGENDVVRVTPEEEEGPDDRNPRWDEDETWDQDFENEKDEDQEFEEIPIRRELPDMSQQELDDFLEMLTAKTSPPKSPQRAGGSGGPPEDPPADDDPSEPEPDDETFGDFWSYDRASGRLTRVHRLLRKRLYIPGDDNRPVFLSSLRSARRTHLTNEDGIRVMVDDNWRAAGQVEIGYGWWTGRTVFTVEGHRTEAEAERGDYDPSGDDDTIGGDRFEGRWIEDAAGARDGDRPRSSASRSRDGTDRSGGDPGGQEETRASGSQAIYSAPTVEAKDAAGAYVKYVEDEFKNEPTGWVSLILKGNEVLRKAGSVEKAAESLWEVREEQGLMNLKGVECDSLEGLLHPDLLAYLRSVRHYGMEARYVGPRERVKAKLHPNAKRSIDQVFKQIAKDVKKHRALVVDGSMEELGGTVSSPFETVDKQMPDRSISTEKRLVHDQRNVNCGTSKFFHPPALQPAHGQVAQRVLWMKCRCPGLPILMAKKDIAGAFRLLWLRPADVELFAGDIPWAPEKAFPEPYQGEPPCKGDITVLYLVSSFGFSGSPGEWCMWGRATEEYHRAHRPAERRRDLSVGFDSKVLVDDCILIEPWVGLRPWVSSEVFESGVVQMLGKNAVNQEKDEIEGAFKTTQTVWGVIMQTDTEKALLPERRIQKGAELLSDSGFDHGEKSLTLKQLQQFRGIMTGWSAVIQGLANELKAADKFLAGRDGGAAIRLSFRGDGSRGWEEKTAWDDLWELFEVCRWLSARSELWDEIFTTSMRRMLPPLDRLALPGEWDEVVFVSSDATPTVMGAIDWKSRTTFRETAKDLQPWVQRALTDEELSTSNGDLVIHLSEMLSFVAFACAMGPSWQGKVVVYGGDNMVVKNWLKSRQSRVRGGRMLIRVLNLVEMRWGCQVLAGWWRTFHNVDADYITRCSDEEFQTFAESKGFTIIDVKGAVSQALEDSEKFGTTFLFQADEGDRQQLLRLKERRVKRQLQSDVSIPWESIRVEEWAPGGRIVRDFEEAAGALKARVDGADTDGPGIFCATVGPDVQGRQLKKCLQVMAGRKAWLGIIEGPRMVAWELGERLCEERGWIVKTMEYVTTEHGEAAARRRKCMVVFCRGGDCEGWETVFVKSCHPSSVQGTLPARGWEEDVWVKPFSMLIESGIPREPMLPVPVGHFLWEEDGERLTCHGVGGPILWPKWSEERGSFMDTYIYDRRGPPGHLRRLEAEEVWILQGRGRKEFRAMVESFGQQKIREEGCRATGGQTATNLLAGAGALVSQQIVAEAGRAGAGRDDLGSDALAQILVWLRKWRRGDFGRPTDRRAGGALEESSVCRWAESWWINMLEPEEMIEEDFDGYAGGRRRKSTQEIAEQVAQQIVSNVGLQVRPFSGEVSERVEEWLEENMTGDKSAATEKAYAGAWAKWCAWARRKGWLSEYLSKSEDIVHRENKILSYVGYLGWLGCSVNTIRQAIFAIKTAHKRIGEGDITDGMHRVWILLGGLDRRNTSRKPRRLGVTQEMISWLGQHLVEPFRGQIGNTSYADAVTVFAAISTAWFYMLRAKEYAESNGVDHDMIVRGCDVRFMRGGFAVLEGETEVALQFRKTKTDQLAFGDTKTLKATGVAYLCGRWAMGGVVRRLEIQHLLQKSAAAVGLEGDRFMSHSLRIGGATALYQATSDIELVKRLGRWSWPGSVMDEKYERRSGPVGQMPQEPLCKGYFLRPYLRLSSWSVHRAAKELSPKSALVASDAEQGANDGLIDVIAQRCLDCPRLARQQQPGGRQSRSQMHVPAARFHALARAYSYGHVDNGEEEKPLQRGRWHELHVPDSDHCLGTWFDQRSEKMYENLFKILRKRLH